MAGQIGFLPDATSTDPRASVVGSKSSQSDFGSGRDFRQSLNELNAERPAERTLAQQPTNIATNAIESGLPASVTLTGEGALTDINFNAAPFEETLISEELGQAAVSINPSDIAKPGKFRAERIDGLPQQAPGQQLQESVPEFATANPDDPNKTQEIQIRTPSLGDGDVPPAPLQPRSERTFNQAPVTAFTPFQQSAAAVLPTSTAPEIARPTSATITAQALPVTQATSSEVAADIAPRNAQPIDQILNETPLAPSQSGTAQLALQVPVSADSPLPQQNDAAVLPGDIPDSSSENAEAIIIDAETPVRKASDTIVPQDSKIAPEIAARTAAVDAVTGDMKQIASLESPLASSQAGQTPSTARAQLPAAIAPTLQQNQAAVVTAQVADIPNVLSDSLSLEDGSKKITVQLDPPELGRVSIDFKFDGNTLQNVLVTGETPEAMKRLRLMHFELVQTLESHGFSGQDLEFSQRQDDRQAPIFAEDVDGSAAPYSQEDQPYSTGSSQIVTRQSIATDGLDLKL